MVNVYAVKTTVNQELAVATMVEGALGEEGVKDHGIRAIMVPEELKGYLLVEASFPEALEQIIQSIPHARGLVKGKKVDEAHEEITIELFEAMVPIPVTVRGDSVRVLSKEENEAE
jgi:transcriptional antiterminator NusG